MNQTSGSIGKPSPGCPLVRLRGISRRYGSVEAVKPLNLDIEAGDFFALLGPSGCGKTTLLRMIAGFVEPSTGMIEIDGRDVSHLSPERRPTNMVFQGYGLFPHMTVQQNIAYGLRVAKLPQDEIDRRCEEIIALVRLQGLENRNIGALSGGQQQRVALARALVMQPKVLLLDEPLGALDLKLRQVMQEELRRIHQQTGGTFVFVTHDQTEALALANRIAVMKDGVLVQEGAPEEIYAAPRTRFVATFIGDANVLPGCRHTGRVDLEVGTSFANAGADRPVVAVVRPEAVKLGRPCAADEAIELSGTVKSLVFFGSYIRCEVETTSGHTIIANSSDLRLRETLVPGQSTHVWWSLQDQRVLEDT